MGCGVRTVFGVTDKDAWQIRLDAWGRRHTETQQTVLAAIEMEAWPHNTTKQHATDDGVQQYAKLVLRLLLDTEPATADAVKVRLLVLRLEANTVVQESMLGLQFSEQQRERRGHPSLTADAVALTFTLHDADLRIKHQVTVPAHMKVAQFKEHVHHWTGVRPRHHILAHCGKCLI